MYLRWRIAHALEAIEDALYSEHSVIFCFVAVLFLRGILMLSLGSCCNLPQSSPPGPLYFDLLTLKVLKLVRASPRNSEGRAGQSLRQQLLSTSCVPGKVGGTTNTK